MPDCTYAGFYGVIGGNVKAYGLDTRCNEHGCEIEVDANVIWEHITMKYGNISQ